MQTIEFYAEKYEWSVDDLRQFLSDLNTLYSVLYVFSQLKPDAKLSLSHFVTKVPKYDQLLINHIEIHSPARISLNGVAGVIKQLRLLLRDIIGIRHQSKMDRVEHAKAIAGLLRENGFPKEEVDDVIRRALKISKFMHQRKITMDGEKNG